jgi:hypothetical protein
MGVHNKATLWPSYTIEFIAVVQVWDARSGWPARVPAREEGGRGMRGCATQALPPCSRADRVRSREHRHHVCVSGPPSPVSARSQAGRRVGVAASTGRGSGSGGGARG